MPAKSGNEKHAETVKQHHQDLAVARTDDGDRPAGLAGRPLSGLSPEHLDWCREQIRRHCSRTADIVSVLQVPSRTAQVYRLVAATPSGQTAYFLKCYPHPWHEADLNERFSRLYAIAETFERSDIVSPYRVIGSNAELGLLLTLETAGDSLLTIHRTMTRRLGLGDATAAVRAWYGLGVWLDMLHWRTLPSRLSTTRVSELAEYTGERFQEWGERDPRRARLARRALETVAFVASEAARRPVRMTLCHGDVSAGNIIVGKDVSLVDPDDSRFDMPALDISQALMELREFGFVASVVPLRGFARTARAAFVAGYGHRLPEGPEFWLPHLRNLSVYLLTLARRCRGISMYRVSEEVRYRRTIRELKRCMKESRSSGGATAYPV